MQGHFWHLFLAQFFMLFHMVALVLLSMVAFLTIFLLAENLQQPIRVFEIGGYWSCHGEQNASYHVKEDKNLYQKMVSKVTLHFVWGHLSRKQTVAWFCRKGVVTMTIISPTREYGVVRTIFESSWSGPWTLGSKNDPSWRKYRYKNTLP